MSTISPGARAFYEGVLWGSRRCSRTSASAAYPVGPASVFLLFLRGATQEVVTLPGGSIPPHDGSGADALRLRDCGELSRGMARAVRGRRRGDRVGDGLAARCPSASISAIRTAIWSNSRRPACGRTTDRQREFGLRPILIVVRGVPGAFPNPYIQEVVAPDRPAGGDNAMASLRPRPSVMSITPAAAARAFVRSSRRPSARFPACASASRTAAAPA